MAQSGNTAAHALTIPVPTMGWNTRDNIADMDPRYALEAENFWSDGATVDLRLGYRYFAKGFGSSILTSYLATLELASGSKLLTIGDDGRPYNATSGGGAPTDLSSAGTRKFSGIVNSVTYRGKLFLKDSGNNPCYYWDGLSGSVTAAAFVGPGGADTALTNISVYRNRLVFTGNDLSIWYTPLFNITGALTQYDFQGIFTNGGRLLFAGGGTKTGDENQQYFVLISTTGEILVYQGDSPESSNWGKVGHYYGPPPFGHSAFFYWGADLVIITCQGLVLLSEILKGDSDLNFLSEPINDRFVSEIAYATLTSGCFSPYTNMLIINIQASGSDPVQFVMNTRTKSWWKWTNIISYYWATFNKELYFAGLSTAGKGKIYKAWNGYFDESEESEGVAQSRTIKLRPAYNYFGDKESYKQFVRAVPIMYQSEGFQLTMNADVDMGNTPATQICEPDNNDLSYKLYKKKIGLTGIGQCASLRIDQTVTTKRMSLQAIRVLWNDGNID